MQVRRITLAVAVVGIFGLVAYLFIQVNAGGSGANVSAEEKARALAEYERRNKLASADVPAPAVTRSEAPREKRTKPARPEKPEDQTFEKPTRPNTERPSRAGLSMSQPAIALSAGGGGDPELKKKMNEVSAAYDTGDYPTAHDLAVKVLEESPRNIKMLRVVVSTSCSEGNGDEARKYATQLPERDRKQLASRCKRWGVDL